MQNTIQTVDRYRLSDAQIETLSKFAWHEAGKPFRSGLRVTSGPTLLVLVRLGLAEFRYVEGDAVLTTEGRRVAADLPDWDWS